jgi:predicted P-loop ATPase
MPQPEPMPDIERLLADEHARVSLKKGMPAMPDWRDLLIKNDKGVPRALLANAGIALRFAPELVGRLHHNTFTLANHIRGEVPWESLSVDRPWSDRDDVLCCEWLQKEGIHVHPPTVSEVSRVVAAENPYHPVRDYLDSLKWDKKARLKKFVSEYLGADPSNYTYAIGQRFFISCVARIYQPGCKADCMPILEGRQGARKSTAIRELVPDPKWATDEIADIGSKDSSMQTMGIWLIEIAELDSMSRAEVSKIKAFLSRTTDRFRPPYGRSIIESARQCVFIGSVNNESYLRDETGGRRFWPIRCGTIQVDRITADRDQLWAEAVHRFRAGENWWLDSELLNEIAEEQQEERYVGDPWDPQIAELIATRPTVSVREVLTALKIDPAKWTQADSNRIARCLRAKKWTRYQERSGTDREWRYRRPAGPSPVEETTGDGVVTN